MKDAIAITGDIVSPLSEKEWEVLNNLPHKDPADRFIAATALVYGLRLMTDDKRLLDASWLPTADL